MRGRDGENYEFDAASLLASGATLPSSVTMATDSCLNICLSLQAISFSRLSPGADALRLFRSVQSSPATVSFLATASRRCLFSE